MRDQSINPGFHICKRYDYWPKYSMLSVGLCATIGCSHRYCDRGIATATDLYFESSSDTN